MEVTLSLGIRLGTDNDLEWAQRMVVAEHYLHQRVDNRARPMVYIIGDYLGLIMAGIPHATRCRGWFGYPGLPTQWQVLDLNRIWLSPRLQAGGDLYQHNAASWAIGQVLKRVQLDRVSLWPPVFPGQPYHIRLVISYHDPQYHRGIIYKATNARPMYTRSGQPIPGPAGKYGWAWPMKEPRWTWQDIHIRRPRTMRLF